MITLHNKDFTTKYGSINTICEAFVEEERNGLFELSFIMLNTDSLFNYVKEENIVVANANDTLLNQKFRIYMTRKLMNNRVEVFARHISFDLMYDYIDNLSFTNQSCQYVLNQLFINSSFSKHYKGYSDIVNAQNYKMSMANILEAIGGKSGSVIDTFGNGAEILRDNENIHVLNRRGYDNEVTIEYRKNLTGFELEEDTTDLVTRILPYAKYNDAETSEEITVKADFVDSPLINNYSHPYIKAIDYSERFDEEEIPTEEKLINLAKKEYNINKVDIPKQNFKIDFIPLSKCVGYEGLEDKINICDTVTIIDTRYGINTQAKVIKTVFNVLKNRYESIELGDPKTTLGDIIGSGGDNEPVVGPPGPPGPAGEDGNLGDFPNSLPATPILESFVYGFSNIELSWTFENKIYYQYELYASKVKDFVPNTFDLIFQGQASSYMFQAQPNEIWYFKVCGINTYGERTEFSNQVEVTTTKISDLSNYVENMAIGEALIGKLSLDRGWIGKLNANLLDVKGNFSVTDGNGKRTLDIDSFGNVNLDVASLKISAKNVATQDYTNNTVNTAKNEVIENANSYTDGVKEEFYTNLEITANGINSKVSSLNDKYTEIKQTIDGIDLTGKVSFSDLSTQGKTTIHGGNIQANTISINNLKSNNTNPIIRLFEHKDEDGNNVYCSLDATNYNEEGQGNAIRLKWDRNNYILQKRKAVDFYMGPREAGNAFGFNSDYGEYSSNYESRIYTREGTLCFRDDGNLYHYTGSNNYNRKLLTTYDINTSIDYNSASHVASASAVKKVNDKITTVSNTATNAYNTANTANSRANSAYSLASSHSHNGQYWSSLNLNTLYSNYLYYQNGSSTDWAIMSAGHLAPISSSSWLGSYNHNRWGGCMLVNSPNVSSDARLKENIKYIEENKAKGENALSHKKLYDFIRNNFKIAEYNYIIDEDSLACNDEEYVKSIKALNNHKIGFIAQDIVDTEVGSRIVTQNTSDGFYGYDTGNLTTVIAGALQEEMKKREELENEISNLKNELESIKELIKNMKEGAFNA